MIRGDYDRHKPEAGINLSWGAVIAGAISFVAVFAVLSLITSALGFGFLNPSGPEPLAGVGTATAIAVIVTLLASFFVGGVVAGFAARRTGKLHGFLAWALSIVLLFTVVISALTSIVSTTANLAGSVVSSAGQVAGSVASTAGDAISTGAEAAYNQIADQLGPIDTDQAVQDAEDILRGTGIDELQPEYLEATGQAARDEIVQAGRDLVVNPENSDEIIDNLLNSLSQRAEEIGQAVDRDAISNSVAVNTDLTDEEAEEAVDNIATGLEQSYQEAQVMLDNASTQIEETRVQVSQGIDSAVETVEDTAQDVTDGFSTGSLLIFVGLVIGLGVSVFGGDYGHKQALSWYERYVEEVENDLEND